MCINGSHEEVDLNRAADMTLLCDPGAFFDALVSLDDEALAERDSNWFELNCRRRLEWVAKMYADVNAEAASTDFGDQIHPLHLALDVQEAMQDDDWLVIDGGNTHFWSEIAVNMAGSRGLRLGGVLHPGTFSLLGVGVSFALSAKNLNPKKNVVLISGDGAFLSGGLSIETAFQEGRPIIVVIDNNGGLDCISQQWVRRDYLKVENTLPLISATSPFTRCSRGLVVMAS